MATRQACATTVINVMRWLLLVAVTGLLGLHGFDAAATSAHGETVPVVAPPMASSSADFLAEAVKAEVGPDQPHGRESNLLHHVAGLCIVVLITGIAAVAARLVARCRRLAGGTTLFSQGVEAALDFVRPPPPAWLRLRVDRR